MFTRTKLITILALTSFALSFHSNASPGGMGAKSPTSSPEVIHTKESLTFTDPSGKSWEIPAQTELLVEDDGEKGHTAVVSLPDGSPVRISIDEHLLDRRPHENKEKNPRALRGPKTIDPDVVPSEEDKAFGERMARWVLIEARMNTEEQLLVHQLIRDEEVRIFFRCLIDPKGSLSGDLGYESQHLWGDICQELSSKNKEGVLAIFDPLVDSMSVDDRILPNPCSSFRSNQYSSCLNQKFSTTERDLEDSYSKLVDVIKSVDPHEAITVEIMHKKGGEAVDKICNITESILARKTPGAWRDYYKECRIYQGQSAKQSTDELTEKIMQRFFPHNSLQTD